MTPGSFILRALGLLALGVVAPVTLFALSGHAWWVASAGVGWAYSVGASAGRLRHRFEKGCQR